MKLRTLAAAAITVFFIGCSNAETTEEIKDSANMLHDTLPANSLADSIGLDSNPADATHVDSLEKITR